MCVEFWFCAGNKGNLDIGNFDKVSARLRKGEMKSTDLPVINDAFNIIKSLIEDLATKQGMTYEQYVEFLKKKEREEKENQQNREEGAEPSKTEPPQEDHSKKTEDNTSSNAENGSRQGEPKKKTRDGRNKPKGGKPSGSGKRSIAKSASKTINLDITGVAKGDSCPCCNNGTMHPIVPGVIGRIHVNPTFTIEHVQVEKLRCNTCGQAIAAEVPPALSDDHIRGASFAAAASLLVQRHHLAIPNLRIERLNGWLGSPFSDARQWDIMRDSASALLGIYEAILQFAADASVQILDDGWCRIICIHRAIQEEIKAAESIGIRKEDLRTGINTTAILGYEGKHVVCAYISGRKHQGENAHTLNLLRSHDTPVVRMTDAASKTTSTHEFPEPDPRGFVLAHGGKTIIDSRVNTVHCLTHLRNKFDDLKNCATELCTFILDRIGSIYEVDDEAERDGLGPQARLALHQNKSTQFVEEIRERINRELAAKTWLPKEPIAKALSYAKEHLDACTAFCRLAGCPLDSNAAERGIIPVVRHRLSSLAFQTDRGALVGDIAMTLSGTAVLAHINPIEYISRCLEFSADVHQNPQAWFPWCYETRWKELKDNRTAERESRQIKNYRLVHRKLPLAEDVGPPFKPDQTLPTATIN
jgi:hypothetical protein